MRRLRFTLRPHAEKAQTAPSSGPPGRMETFHPHTEKLSFE